MSDVKRIGIVLSSGGGRGVYAHTGFMFALRDMGVEVSAVAGCSAGAIVGGVIASGTELEDWSDAIANVETGDFWTPGSWAHVLWLVLVKRAKGYTGLSDNQAAIKFCRSQLKAQVIEDCAIPFSCLAFELGTRKKKFFSTGDMATRMMASAAMPLLYRPVRIGNELYCDGATIELGPTEAICCDHRLDALIVHHVSLHRDLKDIARWAERRPWAFIEILNLLLYRERPWYLSDQGVTVHRCPCGCGMPIVVIEPELPELSWPLHVGGVNAQNIAREQSIRLLKPYLSALKYNPASLFKDYNDSPVSPEAGGSHAT